MLNHGATLPNDDGLLTKHLEAIPHVSQYQLFEKARNKSQDHSYISGYEVQLNEVRAPTTTAVTTAVHKEFQWNTDVVISKVFALKTKT